LYVTEKGGLKVEENQVSVWLAVVTGLCAIVLLFSLAGWTALFVGKFLDRRKRRAISKIVASVDELD